MFDKDTIFYTSAFVHHHSGFYIIESKSPDFASGCIKYKAQRKSVTDIVTGKSLIVKYKDNDWCRLFYGYFYDKTPLAV